MIVSEEYRQAIARSPLSAAVWSNFATALTRGGHFKDALKSYDIALACAQGNTGDLLNVTFEASTVGMWKIALRALSEIKSAGTRELHLKLIEARCLLNLDRFGEAEKIATGVLEADPHRWDGIALLSSIRQLKNERRDAAALLEAHLAHDPTCWGAISQLISLQAADKHREEARRLIEILPGPIRERPEFICHEASLAELDHHYQLAAELYQTALAKDPFSAEALLGLAELHLKRLGDRWNAFEYARRLVDLAPTVASSYRVLSESAMIVGEHGYAMERLDNFLTLSPKDLANTTRAVAHRMKRKDFAGAARIGLPMVQGQAKHGGLRDEVLIARCAGGDWYSVIKEFVAPASLRNRPELARILLRCQQATSDDALPNLLANAVMGLLKDASLGTMVFMGLFKHGELRKAIVWADAIARSHFHELSQQQRDALLECARQAGRTDLARKWRAEAGRETSSHQGSANQDSLPRRADVAGYSIDSAFETIQSHVRAGGLTAANDEIIRASGHFPTATDFVQLAVELFLLQGEVEQATQILALLSTDAETRQNKVPSLLKTGISRALECGDVDQAAQILRRVENFLATILSNTEQDVHLIGSLFQFAGKYGGFDLVLKLISIAEQRVLSLKAAPAVIAEAIQKSDPRLALHYFEKIIAANPDEPEVRLFAAKCLVSMSEFELAERQLRQVVCLKPSSLTALDILGPVLESRGSFAEAVLVFKLAYASTDGTIIRAQNLARALRRGGGLEAEIAIMKREILSFPDDLALQLLLGACLLESGELAEADEHLTRSASERRPSIDMLELLVAIRYFRMEFAGARQLIAAPGLEGQAAAPLLRRLSLLHRRLADLPNSLRLLRRAAEMEPANIGISTLIVEQLREMGSIEEAFREAERLRELDPMDPRPYLWLSNLHLDKGDVADARLSADTAMMLNNRDLATLTHCAMIAELDRRFEDACELFDRCMRIARLNGQNAGVRVFWHLVMCQIILGRPQQAIAAHTALCETFDTAFPESCRVWSGEALEGLSLLICMRGGPGDELRVATMCLPWLLSQNLERCTFACDPRLETLLTRTFPEVSFRPTFSGHRLVRRAADERKARVDRAWPGISNRTAEMSVSYSEAPRHDVITHSDRLVHHAYFEGSLLDGKKPACRPLVVDRDRADSFRDMLAGLGPHLKVGLCWRGSYSSAYRNKLFLDIEDILPILQTDGACFIDLQVNKTAEESEKLALAGVHSIPELDLYDDFEGQAALISRLDLVITPGITIRDVAGCLQVPVWSVIIAPGADDLWRSGEDASDCWQSSIKHYGIDLLKTRAALMAQIAGDLANLVESKEKYRKPSKAKQRAS